MEVDDRSRPVRKRQEERPPSLNPIVKMFAKTLTKEKVKNTLTQKKERRVGRCFDMIVKHRLLEDEDDEVYERVYPRKAS